MTKNDFTVREAVPGDGAAIGLVNLNGWRTAYAGIMPEDFLRQRTPEKAAEFWKKSLEAKNSVTLVAQKDGLIRGFLNGGKAREGLTDFDSEVYAIYVDQELRGAGAGETLIRAFWALEAARGSRSCALWVLEANPHRRFYEKMGGSLLDRRQTNNFGGRLLTEAAYAWWKLPL